MNKTHAILGAWMAIAFLDGCSLNSKVREAYEADLKAAQRIRGSGATPMHRKIFGDHELDGRDYISFFSSRISAVKGEGMLLASCHGAVACSDGDHQIRLSTQYVDVRLSWLTRLSLLMHEARHAEGWPHRRCPAGLRSFYLGADLEGVEACDEAAVGAYGVQFVMLKNLEKFCQSCTGQERIEAGNFADALLKQVISAEAQQTLLSDLKF